MSIPGRLIASRLAGDWRACGRSFDGVLEIDEFTLEVNSSGRVYGYPTYAVADIENYEMTGTLRVEGNIGVLRMRQVYENRAVTNWTAEMYIDRTVFNFDGGWRGACGGTFSAQRMDNAVAFQPMPATPPGRRPTNGVTRRRTLDFDLRLGQRVEYLSLSQRRWVPATVIRLNADSSVDLDGDDGILRENYHVFRNDRRVIR